MGHTKTGVVGGDLFEGMDKLAVATSGDLNADRFQYLPATKINGNVASNELNFVKIVVELGAKIFLALARVLNRNSLGDAVTEAVRMAYPFTFNDLDRAIFNPHLGRSADHNISLH